MLSNFSLIWIVISSQLLYFNQWDKAIFILLEQIKFIFLHRQTRDFSTVSSCFHAGAGFLFVGEVLGSRLLMACYLEENLQTSQNSVIKCDFLFWALFLERILMILYTGF